MISDNLISLVRTLVRFKSITPNDDGGIDYIKSLLQQYKFKIIDINHFDTKNIFAFYGDIRKPIISFAGHLDVVPVGDASKWIHDPFELTEKDGYLYGRGIADMKGSIGCFLDMIPTLIQHKNIDDFCIAFILTTDEEGPASNGTIKVVEYLAQNNIRLKYCIIGEPSSTNYVGDVIKIGRRGSMSGEINIIGKQGHIAYPHLAKNPIHLFSKSLDDICKINWDDGNEYFPPTHLQFTNINSGLGVDNVIPNNLIVRFNFRYNNMWDCNNLQQKIIEVLNNNKLDYEIKWYNSAKPFLSNIKNLVKIAQSCIKDVMRFDSALKTDGGTSDGRFLINVCDELIELGLNNSTIHQIDERVKIDELFALNKIYYKIFNKIMDE